MNYCNHDDDWGQFVYIDGHQLERTCLTPPPFFPPQSYQAVSIKPTANVGVIKSCILMFTPSFIHDMINQWKPMIMFVCWLPIFTAFNSFGNKNKPKY